MPRALARHPDVPRSGARLLHIPSQPKPRLPRTLVRAFPPLPCGSLKSRQAFRASQLAPTDKMPVSLINATAEEAADYFRPRPPSPTFAFLPALWHFCLGFGGFRSAFAGFLVPSVLVFPREARTGCLLRDLPAWPRTLNLIRS